MSPLEARQHNMAAIIFDGLRYNGLLYILKNKVISLRKENLNTS